MFACIHGVAAELSSIAEAFAPEFEQTSADTVVFDVDPLRKLYGSSKHIAEAIARRAGRGVNVALAPTVDQAILAARNCPGVSLNPDLSALPVERLPLIDEMLEVLESWGIYTFQQLAALPVHGIAERFGAAGVHLQQLARGTVDRPLRVHRDTPVYVDRIELEHPVSLLEPLSFLMARILNEQCEKLESHAMAANEVCLELELENRTQHVRTLRLPMPMRQSKPLLKLLQMDLEAHPPSAATMALKLSLKPVPPRTVQHGIFQPQTPLPDKLELTLARIRGLVGEDNVGVPELLNTHHPHPFQLARKLPSIGIRGSANGYQAFRYFRPPLKAMVEVESGRPARITASGIAGKVAGVAGPWRSSGNWWSNESWDRDEWDVALINGTLYRLFRAADVWFVEGTYD